MFIAGQYTVTYNSLSIGQTEDSLELEFFLNGDPIRGDSYGDTIQDFVTRGGDCFLSANLLEFDTALTSFVFWYANSTAWGRMDSGIIGNLASTLAHIMVLTKITGPNATPTTLTANLAILAPGFPVRMLFGPRLRRVPIRMQLLPFVSGGHTQFFL